MNGGGSMPVVKFAIGESSFILLHPPQYLVGVSIGMERDVSKMTELSPAAR